MKVSWLYANHKTAPKDSRFLGAQEVGPVIGGTLIGVLGETQGVRLAFFVAFVLAGVSLILQQMMIDDDKRNAKKDDSPTHYGLALLNTPLRNLLVSDILVRFCEQIPYAFVVIWCVSINKITPLQFGLLTTIEMATENG